ncbi:MAG: serine/threonine protein kinase [Acidobacteria bacterium]|nr:serine/threonine protein kinase [Acidobacteriota bacterium]
MATRLPWHQRLAWKFFLRMALALLLALAGVLAVAVRVAERSARQSAGASLRRAVQIVDGAFSQQARIMDAGLEVFTQYSGNQSNIERAMQTADHASLADTLKENLGRLNAEMAVVVHPDGHWFSCTTDGMKQDYSEVGIIHRALNPEAAAAEGFRPPYRGFFRIEAGAFKGTYHAVARSLRLPGGATLGAMLVGRRLDQGAAKTLQELALPSARATPSHLAFLSHFQVLGASGGEGGLDRLLSEAPDFPLAKERVLKGTPSEAIPLALGGRPHLAMLSPLRGANALDLEMAHLLLLPLDPLLEPFRAVQRAVLLAGAGGLLLALLLALQSARRVTAPLGRLAAATAALAEGERPELPPADSRDEVGQLTQGFQALLSELKAKEDLLAALEQVRNQAPESPASQMAPSRLSMSAVDLDATVLVPSASQVAAGAGPQLQRRRVTLREGEIFAGRYRIESILGRGGMGVVLKARDRQLDEEVALKVIRPEHELTPAFLEQLKQEIRLARKITHRHVIRTHDFGESDGIPFVSMEYLRGVTLKQLLDDRGSLPAPLVLRIGRQVAEGLEAAHAVGVVHRDIKPLNVLFDARGDAKLMDFGLAAPVSARGTNEEGQVFGTPRYMAPEQVRGERVDPRTDLYALGIMLYELCTGAPPYDHREVTELLRMQLAAPVPSLAAAPGLPEGLGTLLERLMAKAMDDRPGSAAEVVEILKVISSGGDTRRM